jgi:DNA-binding transcriptional regulator YhcF (GntR family)
MTGISVDTVGAATQALRDADLIETEHGTSSFVKQRLVC